jgi:hypothetical protein
VVPPADRDEEGVPGVEGDPDAVRPAEQRVTLLVGRLEVDSAVHRLLVVDQGQLRRRHEGDPLVSVHLHQQHVHGVVVERGDGPAGAEPHERRAGDVLVREEVRQRPQVAQQVRAAGRVEEVVVGDEVGVVALTGLEHRVDVLGESDLALVGLGVHLEPLVGLAARHHLHQLRPAPVTEVLGGPPAGGGPAPGESGEHDRTVAGVVAVQELLRADVTASLDRPGRLVEAVELVVHRKEGLGLAQPPGGLAGHLEDRVPDDLVQRTLDLAAVVVRRGQGARELVATEAEQQVLGQPAAACGVQRLRRLLVQHRVHATSSGVWLLARGATS